MDPPEIVEEVNDGPTEMPENARIGGMACDDQVKNGVSVILNIFWYDK